MNEELKVADFGKALAYAFNLQVLDVAGCSAITDEFFQHISSGEVLVDEVKTKPGFKYMHSVKMNMLKNINDQSVQKVLQMAPELENLELTGCENLTEYCIETMFKNSQKL